MSSFPYRLAVASVVVALTAIAAHPATAALERADFYVATNGSDENPGTEEAPFATLARARDAVRELRKREPNMDLLVYIRGGTYRLRETVVFSIEDSSPQRMVFYAAYPGEKPVFSSGVPIEGWEKHDGGLPGLPETARGKIWVAQLPKDLDRINTLFDTEGLLPRARTKGFFPDEKGDRHTLIYPEGAVKTWSNVKDAAIVVRPNYSWVMNILPIGSVDENARTVTTPVPATYPMRPVRWHEAYGDIVAKNGSAWIENIFEALDEPGEWVLDTTARRIYLWPRGEQPGDDIVAPALTELIRVEGTINYDGPADDPVRQIRFHGLTFMHADRFSWEADKTGWGLQHDWEMFDRPTALVRFRGAEYCVIDTCRFAHTGGAAIRLDLHCQQNQVVDNVIEHVGGAGILLAGYGPGTKNCNRRNSILNNNIHHVGEVLWHSPAVFAWQSGENEIANNLIHNTPYTAIVASGRIRWDREGKGECSKTVRWHEIKTEPDMSRTVAGWDSRRPYLHSRNNRIERNEIHHAMEILGDGNCIYISGAGGSNAVRENYLHDNVSPSMGAAIRCDDDQHRTTIERNIIHRNYGSGNGIASKGVNTIVNNIIADLHERGGHHRGLISLEQTPIAGSVIQCNILYATDAKSKAYWDGGLEGTKPRLRDCDADRNLYWNTADPEWGQRHLDRERPNGIEQNSLAADPLFVDPGKGDFRFRPGSPAPQIGFQPIDMNAIGLQSGPPMP